VCIDGRLQSALIHHLAEGFSDTWFLSSEIELIHACVRVWQVRDIFRRIVAINFELVPVGIAEIDALRDAVIDGR
jgi:hypothetical protein